MTIDPTSDAWKVLGLAPGADAGEIRQAYARLLRVHRPDSDPVGYQRLRSAYDLLLSFGARTHAGGAAAPQPHQAPETPPASVGQETPEARARRQPCPYDRPAGIRLRAPYSDSAPPPPSPVADHALVREIVDRAATTDVPGFSTWLHAEPRLYELARKQYVATTIIPVLAACTAPLNPKNLDEILTFLALAQNSPETVEVLRRIWERNEKRHAADTGHPGGTPDGVPLRHTLDTLLLLRTPGSPREVFSRALIPGWASQAAKVIDYARTSNRGKTPRTWVPERIALIERLADPTRIGFDRFRLAVTRIWSLVALAGYATPFFVVPMIQLMAVPVLALVAFGYGTPGRRIAVTLIGALVGTAILVGSEIIWPEKLAGAVLAVHAGALAAWFVTALARRQYFRLGMQARQRVLVLLGPVSAGVLTATGAWAIWAGRHYHIYVVGIAALLVALWDRPKAWLPMTAAALFTGFLWQDRVSGAYAAHTVWFAAFAGAAIAVVIADSIARLRSGKRMVERYSGHRRVYDAAALVALSSLGALLW